MLSLDADSVHSCSAAVQQVVLHASCRYIADRFPDLDFLALTFTRSGADVEVSAVQKLTCLVCTLLSPTRTSGDNDTVYCRKLVHSCTSWS